MTRWYSEIKVERHKVWWRCTICQVEETRIIDHVPGQWDQVVYEHDWTFIDDGNVEGRVVCSRACAEKFAAAMVARAYPEPAPEKVTG